MLIWIILSVVVLGAIWVYNYLSPHSEPNYDRIRAIMLPIVALGWLALVVSGFFLKLGWIAVIVLVVLTIIYQICKRFSLSN